MGRKLQSACKVGTCPKRRMPGYSYCDDHQREQWKDTQKDRRERGDIEPYYKTARWRKLRKMQLALEPLCRECKAAADMVDHIKPIRQGGSHADMSNLQSLCNGCHARKRARESNENRSDKNDLLTML